MASPSRSVISRSSGQRAFRFSLACLIRYYRENDPQDDAAAIAFIRTHDLPAVLSNPDLWGRDLRELTPLVEESLRQIETNGIREAIRWSMS